MSLPTAIRLGTRGSQLALWQANTVAARILAAGGPPCQIVVIKTSGDRLQTAPLSEVGGKRLFVKEIEDALITGEVDLAVHSSKDIPALLPAELLIGGVLPREDPRDAVVLPLAGKAAESGGSTGIRSLDDLVASLGAAPRIGTASVRRVAQLVRVLPGAVFLPIRGNLDTRLRKLDAGDYDALVLAAAGLRRLGFESRISFALPVDSCLPAPGQGIVAIEVRADDRPVRELLRRINDETAEAALIAERELVDALGGGCQTPIGALASALAGGGLILAAAVVALDGSRVVETTVRGRGSEARKIGQQAAAQLKRDGAGEILAAAQTGSGAIGGLQP